MVSHSQLIARQAQFSRPLFLAVMISITTVVVQYVFNTALLCRWGVTGGSFVITALLSEAICARRELRDIPLGGCEHASASCIFSVRT